MDLLYKIFYEAYFLFLLIVVFVIRKLGFSIVSGKAPERRGKAADLFICVAVTVVVGTLFDLCPLFGTLPQTDSSVFLYIGKMMHRGFVPYRDLFDHKGIFLYFIEYIGWAICPNGYTGIWLLELAGIFLTVVYLLKLGKLITSDRLITYLSIIAVMLVCGRKVYEGGNLTEEYALPWITISLYVCVKYFKEYTYNKREIVLLGMGLAIVALIRINMIAVWLVFLPFVFVYMLYHKEWHDLRICMVCFAAGVMVILIPVLCYLIYTDSLKAMISYYWDFNLSYTESNGTIYNYFYSIYMFMRLLWPAVLAILVSIIPCRKNMIYIFNMIFGIVSLGLVIMSGRIYAHYAIVLIPVCMIPFLHALKLIYEWMDGWSNRVIVTSTHIKRSICLVLILCCCLLPVLNAIVFPKFVNWTKNEEAITYLKENTSEEDDVLIMGNDVVYYLYTNRYTKNKFFYQTPPINISDSLFKEFITELDVSPSDVVLVFGNRVDILGQENNIGRVCQALESRCREGQQVCEEYNGFFVYKSGV